MKWCKLVVPATQEAKVEGLLWGSQYIVCVSMGWRGRRKEAETLSEK
jgi:hypothetical protein